MGITRRKRPAQHSPNGSWSAQYGADRHAAGHRQYAAAFKCALPTAHKARHHSAMVRAGTDGRSHHRL